MKSKILVVSKWFGVLNGSGSVRTKTEPFGQCQNQEPQYGPVLADTWTVDRTTQNRTKSSVRTMVLDRTTAALNRGEYKNIQHRKWHADETAPCRGSYN